MSVSSTVVPIFRWFGASPEKGGPHGFFAGVGSIAGDVSGGSSALNVNFGLPELQGMILMFRMAVLRTTGTTARATTAQFQNSYWSPTAVVLNAGLTAVGETDTAFQAINSAAPQLFVPEANINSGTVLTFTTPNTDGESNHAFVFGDVWLEERLRKEGLGPLIRW